MLVRVQSPVTNDVLQLLPMIKFITNNMHIFLNKNCRVGSWVLRFKFHYVYNSTRVQHTSGFATSQIKKLVVTLKYCIKVCKPFKPKLQWSNSISCTFPVYACNKSSNIVLLFLKFTTWTMMVQNNLATTFASFQTEFTIEWLVMLSLLTILLYSLKIHLIYAEFMTWLRYTANVPIAASHTASFIYGDCHLISEVCSLCDECNWAVLGLPTTT